MNDVANADVKQHGSLRDREIVDARVIVTCPGRNLVTLRIETRSGVFGLGDATLNGRELAVASYLTDHLIPNLIGRDAGRIEDTWQFFYRGAYWRRGPVTMTAIAAIDVALWDILAKMAGLPLYQLLGGRSRDGVLVYGHASGADLAQTSDEVGRYVEKGFLAIRAQSGVPGLKKNMVSRKASRSMNRQRARCPQRRSGRRRAIWNRLLNSLSVCARIMGPISSYSTMCIID